MNSAEGDGGGCRRTIRRDEGILPDNFLRPPSPQTIVELPAMPTLDLPSYESLEEADLIARIQRVRREMGPRLLILGHHYQQDAVIALADLRGDSYGLAHRRPKTPSARRSSSAASTSWPKRPTSWPIAPSGLPAWRAAMPGVLPDLAAGCSLADMANIGAGRRLLAATGRRDRYQRPDADHLCQFGGGLEGILRPPWRDRLHVGQRPRRARLGAGPPQPRVVLPRSASGPKHRPRDGHPARTDAAVGPAQEPLGGNSAESCDPPQPCHPLAWLLQRSPDVSTAACRPNCGRNTPASMSSSIPSA